MLGEKSVGGFRDYWCLTNVYCAGHVVGMSSSVGGVVGGAAGCESSSDAAWDSSAVRESKSESVCIV